MSLLGFSNNRRHFLTTILPASLSACYSFDAISASGAVNLYNWRRYIGDSTIEDFKAATGITVLSEVYSSNREMLARLKSGNPGFDVIVPSNQNVERLLQSSALLPLEHARIPNIAHINNGFLSAPFDPGRQFSLPYLWSVIGIGYRKSAVSNTPSSWSELLSSDEHAGRIALLKDQNIVTQIALKMLNLPRNEESLLMVENLIKKQKANITAFAPDNGQDLLLSGEVDLAMEWSSDIQAIMREDDDIGFVIPDEGGLLWEDCLCIPQNAPNIDNAYTLINYLLDPSINSQIATQTATYPGSDHHKHLFYKI